MGRRKFNQATWVTDWLDEMKRFGEREGIVDPIDYLSEGGGCDRLTDASGGYGSADYECVHGRLPGDRCPQPATVPAGIQGWTVNRNRLWDKPYPCDCWGEVTVKATPDLVATLAGATLSHDARAKPVQIPTTPVHEVENGRKPATGRARSRRNVSGVVSADRY
jgi:hypothetical protein